MDEATFQAHVLEALDQLPQEFKDRLTNVEITVADEPTEEQRETLKLRRFDRLFGLYTGVPQIVPGEERANFPDRITLFRLPMMEAHDTEELLIKQIRDTLYHEIGHYFGIDEARLHELRDTKPS